MEITICGMCRALSDGSKVFNWVEIRWGEGMLAKFFDVTNRKIVICGKCFEKIKTVELK
jgi:hypothetical protein